MYIYVVITFIFAVTALLGVRGVTTDVLPADLNSSLSWTPSVVHRTVLELHSRTALQNSAEHLRSVPF